MEETILIIDFGSQYTQLIARRVRELNVYCEIHPCHKIPPVEDHIIGIILSGSPFSVSDPGAPRIDLASLRKVRPLLAICYGAQYIASNEGGQVAPSRFREYGRAHLTSFDGDHPLLKGVTENSQVWMSHGDTIEKTPEGGRVIASTEDVHVAGYEIRGEHTFGIQFHPEVYHSLEGKHLISNFVVDICQANQTWTPSAFTEEAVEMLKEQIKGDKVVLGLSGGVDSSVAAILLHKAIGKNLFCIFVDTGLLRKDEFNQVLESYKDMGLNVKGIDAQKHFYEALKGIKDPEKKRKAIGNAFIDVFDREAHAIKGVKWLGQGTIYPDVIESFSVNGPSVTIKSHHNVGGLPEKMNLKVVEPLRALFKDEVRRVGRSMGIGEHIMGRHPFPGPGLAIRIPGEVTPEKVALLQEVDALFLNLLEAKGLYNDVWQAGAILLPVQSVGVMGDERTYEYVVALRAVSSTDGMTADWVHLPYEFLAKVSNEIINKIKGVNRVVYDISSKPPATIEWE